MSKKKSTDINSGCLKNVNRWEAAIEDAQKTMESARSKVVQMKRAIKAFEVMRDSGEPWPGTAEAGVGEPKTETRRLHRE